MKVGSGKMANVDLFKREELSALENNVRLTKGISGVECIFHQAILIWVSKMKVEAGVQTVPPFQKIVNSLICWCQPAKPDFGNIYEAEYRKLYSAQHIYHQFITVKNRPLLCDHSKELCQIREYNNGMRLFDENEETKIKFPQGNSHQHRFVSKSPHQFQSEKHCHCRCTSTWTLSEAQTAKLEDVTNLKSDCCTGMTTHFYQYDSNKPQTIRNEIGHINCRTVVPPTIEKTFAERQSENTATKNELQHILGCIGSVYIQFVLFILSSFALVFYCAQRRRLSGGQSSLQQLQYEDADPIISQQAFIEVPENNKTGSPIPGTATKFAPVVSDPNTSNAETSSRRVDDLKREIYRLTTFQTFPQSVRINPSDYARAGFYFTGQNDTVQCFACNNTLNNLGPRIDPFLLRFHRSTCGFTRNTDNCGNVPFNVGVSSRGSNSMPAGRPAAGELLTRHSSPSQPSSYREPHFTPTSPPQNVAGPAPGLRTPAYQTARPIAPSAFSTARPSPPAPEYDYPLMRQMANITDPSHEQLVRSLDLGMESQRLRSFTPAWNRDHLPPPALMARAGWFFLGNLDRTQCFSCGQVLRNWRRADDPLSEHLRHFPHCSMAQGNETRNVPDRAQPPPPVRRARLTQQEKIDLRAMFPCDRPVNPTMRTHQSRAASFRNWSFTRATPDMIAEAGFFSLGVRDRVKCYYCNGGLQNWRMNDDPWEEHAKWYPTCEYLLQNRGPEYIHSVVSRFPDLDRPVLRAPGQDVPPAAPNRVESGPERLPPPQPKIVDPAVQMQQEESLLEEAMRSDVATTVIGMGFEEAIVRRLMRENIEEHGAAYQSASALLDAVLNLPSSQEEEEEMQVPAQETTPAPAHPSSASQRESPIDENEDIYASEEMEQGRSEHSYSSTSGIQESMQPEPNSYQDPSGYSSALFGTSLSATNSALLPPLSPRGGLINNMSHERTYSGPVQQSHLDIPTTSRATSLPEPSRQATRPLNEERLKRRLQQLQDEKLCKVCLDRTADVVFIPCGHICCCLECTKALRACPICRVRIEKAVKTYTS